ncbi:MAG: acetylglutamate kinase [Spirochaetota bacterium]
MERYIEKAKTLVEALPYIRLFNGKTIVIKYGGSAMVEDALRSHVLEDIVLMRLVGINPVVVHGGGKHITELSKRLGIESKFVNGLRVTDSETMMITQMVLAGLINKDIVADIALLGGKACGISGKDGGLIMATKKSDTSGTDYGFVGDIEQVNPELLRILEENSYIPVVSPVGTDDQGDSLNINADVAAARIAEELKAEKIIYLTDVDGILRNKKDPSTLIPVVSASGIETLKREGIIESGMIPKVDACVRALNRGVGKVHIINGTVPHALILEVFTDSGIGTEITQG